MSIVAVISEFNPFHGGHEHLFREIRRINGEDTAIVCIMSGNFVQRGEAALVRKQVRAEAALLGGCDLVLELPFPYSSSAAERFARAGVAIADALDCVDRLAFGSECGDPAALMTLASRLERSDFREAYYALSAASGSAAKTEEAYRRLYGEDDLLPILRQPNDLLGIEYLRALLRAGSKMQPLPIKRVGAGHDEEMKEGTVYPSGKSIRETLACSREEALSYLPKYSADLIKNEISERKSAADNQKLMEYLLMYYRLRPKGQSFDTDGMAGGLGERVVRAAWEASNGADFFARLRTKKYSDAFLRRALLVGALGVCREMLNAPPQYTQVLGMTERGQAILADLRGKAEIAILTKPGDYSFLLPDARAQAEISSRADSLYAALFCAPLSPSDMMRYFPTRKK